MTKTYCEFCEALQPPDWKPGDFCTSCGNVSRKENRCAWCTHEVPAAKFCRDCGFQMVEADLFGVARILKDGNVDKLSIAAKIAEMDGDTIAHYRSLYNRHYAVMMNRIDELRFFENFTVYQNYSTDLHKELIEQIPFKETQLAYLKGGSQGPFDGRPDKIWESINECPIDFVKSLATLASVQINSPEWQQSETDKLIPSLFDQFPPIPNHPQGQTEYFAALSHPDALMYYIRERHDNYQISRSFQPKVVSFVETYWKGLNINAQAKVIPLVYQFRFLPQLEDYQASFDLAIEQAFQNKNENLSLAAALSSRNEDWILKFLAPTVKEKKQYYATEIAGFHAIERVCLRVLDGPDLDLKESLIAGLYKRGKMAFSETVSLRVAKGLEDYLKTHSDGGQVAEAAYVLTKLNKENEKHQSKVLEETVDKMESGESVLQLFNDTTDIPTCNDLIEKLMQFPLSKETIRAIKTKLVFFKLDFSENALRLLLNYGKTASKSQVENILSSVVSQGSASSFRALRLFWNALFFEKADEHYHQLFYHSSFYKPTYINPKSGEAEKLSIEKEKIELFFPGLNQFITAFLAIINSSIYSDEYYRMFWKDKEDDWKKLIENNVDVKTQILKGLLQFIGNDQVANSEPIVETKTWALAFLLEIFDLFDKPQIEKIVTVLKGLPAVSSTKYKGAYESLSKLQVKLSESFGVDYEVKTV